MHCSNWFISLPELGGNEWSFLIQKKNALFGGRFEAFEGLPVCTIYATTAAPRSYMPPPTIDNGPLDFYWYAKVFMRIPQAMRRYSK